MLQFLVDHYLSILVFLPVLFALLIPFVKEDNKALHTYAAFCSGLLFLLSMLAWNGGLQPGLEILQTISIPSLGITYALGSNGLTITMVVLTTLLLLLASLASITTITKRLKLYYAMLFILTTAVLGVFTARDLFLFFLFWELELIPMYFLIAIWGGPRRDYAATKFVLYTLFGSIFLVGAMLALYFHAANTGANPTTLFMYETLRTHAQSLPLNMQVLVFLGFFITFIVKLPSVPLHTWLPDAHVEAPTPISMLLAGILLKMGAYGLLVFCFGFLPEAAKVMAPYVGLLAVINIVYTAGVALAQKDMKKLIAYSSVSHMGFVLLGLAALNPAGFNGAVFVMFSHGLVSAALFMCVGTLYTRTHSRMIADYGGFAAKTPIIFYFFLFMGLASVGLPLLISFASETLVFYGAFISNAYDSINLFGADLAWSIQRMTAVAAIGIIIGAGYTLWLLQRVFFGGFPEKWNNLADATRSEIFVLGTLALLVMAYGFVPSLLTRNFEPDVTRMAWVYTGSEVASAMPCHGQQKKEFPCHGDKKNHDGHGHKEMKQEHTGQ